MSALERGQLAARGARATHRIRADRLLLLVAVVALAVGCGSTASSSPSAGPTPAGTPAASATTAPPTSSPAIVTPTPVAPMPSASMAPADPLLGRVVVTVSDSLVVRSEPRVSDDSTIYEPWLPLGTELTVLGGPVAGSGYAWYLVAPVSFEGLGGPGFGWVAAAGKDSEPWIAPATGATSCVSLEVYVVVAADTLVDIAERHGVTLRSLLAANPQISDPRLIHLGDRITIPPRMTDLGGFGGASGGAEDINNRGQIVGSFFLRGLQSSVLWEGGVATRLGQGAAHAINDRGQVVGSSHATFEFLWQDGVFTDLSAATGEWGWPADINNLGQVVGKSGRDEGGLDSERAFLWQDGVTTDLGTLGGAAERGGPRATAQAINDRGQVVGSSETASGDTHAFLWQDGVMTDLGTLGGASSRASDINNRGQVVGIGSTASGADRAFLWQDGVMADLGTLGGQTSTAYGINDCGQVVGKSETASGDWHAFLWQDGLMFDLGTLGGRSSEAVAINERGEIVGHGRTATDRDHAVLWRLGAD